MNVTFDNMTEKETLAYLAGAMDSDGFFSVKEKTYGVRVLQNSKHPTYSEICGFTQIKSIIPDMLKKRYGGYLRLCSGSTKNSKDIYRYQITNLKAVQMCKELLPYLQVKRQQAELILELRKSKNKKYEQHSYWFQLEYPNWQETELVSPKQALEMLGYCDPCVISNMIKSGVLLALDHEYMGAKEHNKIPKLLIERLIENRRTDTSKKSCLPLELILWRKELYQNIKELNKNGICGTSTYYLTGYHKRKEY